MESKPPHENRNEINDIKSIIKLKEDLVLEIPFYPNNRNSKEFLQSIDIGTLINIHDSWLERKILPIPRKVTIPNYVRNDSLYIKNKSKLKKLVKMIEDGSDISDYQSRKVKENTFNVDDFKQTKTFIKSRDQLLICEGIFHIHLEAYPNRTDEVVLARIDNDIFYFIGVFTHKIFDSNGNDEHKKYDDAIQKYLASIVPSGGAVFMGIQNLAGSSIASTFNQTSIIKILTLVENYQGGISPYTQILYKKIHDRTPMKVSPVWRINQRNIEIYERKNRIVFNSEEIWKYLYSGLRNS